LLLSCASLLAMVSVVQGYPSGATPAGPARLYGRALSSRVVRVEQLLRS
jgi:hypothetical protein